MAMAAREMARFTLSTVIELVATGTLEIGAVTPVVAPLCVALLAAKGVVDEVDRSKQDLKELCTLCEVITAQIIEKAMASNTSIIDVRPLVECVDKLTRLAKRYQNQGRLARMVQFRRDGEDIRRLRGRIEALVPIMGLAGVVNNGEKLEQIWVRPLFARLCRISVLKGTGL